MAEKHPLPILAEYRIREDKTQADLAADLGVAVMTVSRWETGDRRIGVKTLPKVVEFTKIPKSELRPDIYGSAQ